MEIKAFSQALGVPGSAMLAMCCPRGPVSITPIQRSQPSLAQEEAGSPLPCDKRCDSRREPLLSCPLESPATPSKLSHFWKLPFSHLQNRGKNGCSFIELMEGLNNFRALNLAHDHFSTHLIFSSICWITSRSQPLFLPLRIRVANTATHSCLHKVMF